MPSCRACWTTRATRPRQPNHWAYPGPRSTARPTSTGSSPRTADRRAPPVLAHEARAFRGRVVALPDPGSAQGRGLGGFPYHANRIDPSDRKVIVPPSRGGASVMGRLRKPAPLAPGCPDRRTMPHSWEMDCTIGLLVAKSGPDVSGSKNIARPVAVVHHLEPPGGFRRFRVPTQPSPWSRKEHKGICVRRRLETPGLLRFRHAIWAHPRRAHTSIQEFFLGRPRQHPAHAPGRGRAAGDRYGDGERRWRHLADDQDA